MLLLFITAYILFSGLSIVSKYKRPSLYIITKPIPVLFLILVLSLTIFLKSALTHLSFFIISGLFFGLLGDVFLLFSEKYFKHGLFSFLLGHLCYIMALQKSNITVSWIVIMCLILFSFIYCIVLVKNIISKKKQSYIFPVVIYIGVLSFMILICLNFDMIFYNRLSYFAWGGILFGFSDILLSWNRFVNKVWWLELFILSSYYLAQCLITVGCYSIL